MGVNFTLCPFLGIVETERENLFYGREKDNNVVNIFFKYVGFLTS